jgi:adenosylcobinamide kinase/adenosylcobinamide-phosphate guanylyltransferase
MTAVASTLVLGGARSGKSRFAEQIVRESGLEGVYIATAVAGDDEMQLRVARHRERRGDAWRTVEEPLHLTEAIAREAAGGRILLVDCLTLWLSNLMHAEYDAAREANRLIVALESVVCPVVLVSNELGLGLVPETPLGRQFRDEQGRLNQLVAASVGNVAFVAAGLPLWLKRQTHPGSLQP